MPKPSHLRALNSESTPAAPKVAAAAGGASVESPPPPGKRRIFSAAEKLRIVRAAAACTERGSVEALLRREGIYSSSLAAWRKQLGLHGPDGLAERKPGRKPKMDVKDWRIAELEKRAAKLEAKLLLAGKLLDLKKSRLNSGDRARERRGMLMDLFEDLADPSIPLVQASNALGVSQATLYRRTTPPTPSGVRVGAPSPRRLGDSERKAVLDVLHSEPFADQPPPEVYAALLSQGVYLASIRTMYRFAEQGESVERRAQRAPARHVKPSRTATAPNDVWTWDITKLRSAVPGVFFCLSMIIDLFSRMVVGWLLAERAWCQEFISWFNEEHQHSGIALFTPADVFYGRVEEVAARRQTALDVAYTAHPERFPNGPPVAQRPPGAVHINPLPIDDTSEAAAARVEEAGSPRAAAKTPQHETRAPQTTPRTPRPHPLKKRARRRAAAKTPRHETRAPANKPPNTTPAPMKEKGAPHAAARTPRHEARAPAVNAVPS